MGIESLGWEKRFWRVDGVGREGGGGTEKSAASYKPSTGRPLARLLALP